MRDNLTFRQAGAEDARQTETLPVAAHLLLSGIHNQLDPCFLPVKDSEVVAMASRERHGQPGLLGSVAVQDEQRATGRGQALVQGMAWQADGDGVESLVLLTNTAEHSIPRFGFMRIPRHELPQNVFASQELQGACPVSAVVMQLPFRQGPNVS
ncbi:amino-acid N-acetyltransferase [Deinococcus hopiensis KR-140]|uniref:Amino-acid N-acetyltransferase n=1 Tax=Deinococcus hopiensis KR-140 TaxID=695939 RepID=A0A1W1UTE7_9DEIO|nr:amino-acid N-acetyltransferase [Deinococcus hopiensis KR-140]